MDFICFPNYFFIFFTMSLPSPVFTEIALKYMFELSLGTE